MKSILKLLLLILLLIENCICDDYDYDYYSLDLSDGNSPSQIYTNQAGSLVILGDSEGNIYRSTNYGKSWKTSKPLPNGDSYASLVGLVMNEEGDEILFSTDTDLIFYSSDYGAAFKVVSTGRECSIMSASSDLQTVVCIGGQLVSTSSEDDGDDSPAEYNQNHIYYSKDGGYSWSKSDAKNARWMGIVSNEDASWIFAVIKHTMNYVWGSSDGGEHWKLINGEEKNDWGCLAGSKNLNTMILTDVGTRNVHISNTKGYLWTQVYEGEYVLDDSITVNACSVAAYSDEDDNDSNSLALGFTGQSMQVALDCFDDVCHDEWNATGDSDEDADTYSVALSANADYFYSIDSKTSKIAIGTRK